MWEYQNRYPGQGTLPYRHLDTDAGGAPGQDRPSRLDQDSAVGADRARSAAGRGIGHEVAAFTSLTTVFSTLGLHFLSAYDTGHRSPSSRFAASWKPRVEYL